MDVAVDAEEPVHRLRPCRPWLILALLALAAPVAACESAPAVGEMITCHREWSCAGSVVASNDESFCTDPRDADRPARIDIYTLQFADTCDGVNVRCSNGAFATCASICSAVYSSVDGRVDPCAIEDVEFIRL